MITYARDVLLVINCGSSSLKFGIYRFGDLQLLHHGSVSGIGAGAMRGELRIVDSLNRVVVDAQENHADRHHAVHRLVDWMRQTGYVTRVRAVGHRMVHGGRAYREATVATEKVLKKLREEVPKDPLHMSSELEVVGVLREVLGINVVHIVCFDTTFFSEIDEVARTYGLPRAIRELGVQRYGFHGLSYAYVLGRLHELEGEHNTGRKTIMAHLGSGASMVAVARDGDKHRPVDTPMGYTTTGGLVMGTRCGDVDPGALVYLLETGKVKSGDLRRLLNEESGMYGISEMTGEMRELLAREAEGDQRAELAVKVFVHHARRWMGAMAGSLGGCDELVFTGGIGEKSAEIRRRITEGLGYLGLELDPVLNGEVSEGKISTQHSKGSVWVIPTDEQIVIARETKRVLEKGVRHDTKAETPS